MRHVAGKELCHALYDLGSLYVGVLSDTCHATSVILKSVEMEKFDCGVSLYQLN